MKTLLATALALGLATPALAADAEETAILAQVQRFFDGLGAQDAAAMEATLLPDAMLTAQRVQADGKSALSRRSGAAFVEMTKSQAGLSERMWDPKVMRRGPIAMVWAPYEFQLAGNTTHCGIDVFDMVKVDGTWKIAHLMWTQEPQGCEELKASRPR